MDRYLSAWHMTLLTSKIMEQLKKKFNLKMTWELGKRSIRAITRAHRTQSPSLPPLLFSSTGVLRLKFRINDGTHELHRKVPYDYDSEFQDIYMKIAVALMEGRAFTDGCAHAHAHANAHANAHARARARAHAHAPHYYQGTSMCTRR